jgi:beta-galactosidase
VPRPTMVSPNNIIAMKLTQAVSSANTMGVAASLLLAAVASVLPGCSSQPSQPQADSSPRQRILLDADWRFQLDHELGLTNTVSIVKWRWKADSGGGRDVANAAAEVDTSGTEWHDANSGDDTFNNRVGFQWFRTMLPDVPGPHRMIHFETVDDNGTVYLNGRRVVQHAGWNDSFDVRLDDAWKPGGPNSLAVLVENTAGAGGITAAVTLGRLPPAAPEAYPFATAFDDHGWRQVHLPHDYVVEGTFTSTANAGHGSLLAPPAWYRKTFTIPASAAGKSVWIDFEGVFRDSLVYLNGKELGEHKSGYTSFRYDISQAAKFGGENVLAVHVNPKQFEGWWYEGGGIYRHVWLNMVNPVHVAPWGTFVSAELPEPGPDGNAASAAIHINTKLTNAGPAASECEIVSRLVDDKGVTVAEVTKSTTVPAGGEQELAQLGTVEHPRLWSLETPTLYHLLTAVKVQGEMVDTCDTRFGIRTERFDPDKGFLLNGKPVKIQGTCNHQDFAGVGIAVPDSLEYWRVKQLKEMGGNAWRMSHNPPNPELLDACDELGMLVMDENRHLGDTYTDHTSSGTELSNLGDLADMVLRDRNHPSIILWSMCNEEGLQSTAEGARIFAAMMKVVHKYDTTRPISSAMNGGWLSPGFRTVEDLMGVNYSTQTYDRFHANYPKMPMFGSETASTVTTRGEYTNDRAKSFVTSYNMTDGSWEPVGSRAFMAGSFVWTGFDYKGEPSPYGWPAINSQYGIMDMCGFPKDNYYYYQSWWKTNPVIHIMPHWNWPGKEGQNIRVVVFSNCEQVELFHNGQSLGKRDMPRNGHLQWNVSYAAGSLSAKGYNGNALAASETVETTGTPASLRLKTDRTTLVSDAEDVTPVEVDVLDAQGRLVPTADSLVTFSVEGAGCVAGVGNGNPGDHDPDKASFRHAFNGKCMVVVGATDKQGSIRLTATSPGLKEAVMELRAGPGREDRAMISN